MPVRAASLSLAAVALLGSALGGCASQSYDARPTMFGATCSPTGGDSHDDPAGDDGGSARPLELMPMFASTCGRSAFEARIDLSLATGTSASRFDFTLFSATCSPAHRDTGWLLPDWRDGFTDGDR